MGVDAIPQTGYRPMHKKGKKKKKPLFSWSLHSSKAETNNESSKSAM